MQNFLNENNLNIKAAFDNKERCNSQANTKLLSKITNRPSNLYLNSNPINRSINNSNNYNTVDQDNLLLSSQNTKENNYVNTNPNVNNNNFDKNNINTNFHSNLNFNSDFSHENNGSEANSNNNNNNALSQLTELNKILIRFKNSSEKVIEFLANMTRLQENIQKRNPKINELKIEFELKKKELHQTSVENVSFAKKLIENIKSNKSFGINNKNKNDVNLPEENFNDHEHGLFDSNLNNDFNALNNNNINISRNNSSAINKNISAKNFVPENFKNTSSNPSNLFLSSEKLNQNKLFTNNLNNFNNNSNNNTPRIASNNFALNSSNNNSHIPKNPTKAKINFNNNNTDAFSNNKNSESFVRSENSPILVASKNPNLKETGKPIEYSLIKPNQSFRSVKDLNNSTISNKSSTKKLEAKVAAKITKEENCAENVFVMKIEKVNAEKSGASKNKLLTGGCASPIKNIPNVNNNEINDNYQQQEEFEIDSPLFLCSAGINIMQNTTSSGGNNNIYNNNNNNYNNNNEAEKISLLERNIQEYEAKLFNLTKQLDDNSKALLVSEDTIAHLESSLKSTEEKLKEEKAKLKKLMEQVIEKDNEILKLIKYREEVETCNKKIKALEAQIENLNTKLDTQEKDFKEKIHEKDTLISNLTSEISEFNAKKANSASASAENEAKLTLLSEELNNLRIQRDNNLNLFEESKAKLLEKDKETEEQNRIITELKMQKDVLKNDIEQMNKKINLLDEQKEELVLKYTKLEDEMFVKTSDLLASQNSNVEKTKEISEVKSQNVKLQQELDILKNHNLDENESMKALFEKIQKDLEQKEFEFKIILSEKNVLNENLTLLRKENEDLKSSCDLQIKELEEKLNLNRSALENANRRFNDTVVDIFNALPEVCSNAVPQKADNQNRDLINGENLIKDIHGAINDLKTKNQELRIKLDQESNSFFNLMNSFSSNVCKFKEAFENKPSEIDYFCQKQSFETPKLNKIFELSEKLLLAKENKEAIDINLIKDSVDLIFNEKFNLVNLSLKIISKFKESEIEKESIISNLKKSEDEKLNANNTIINLEINNNELLKDLEKLKADYEKEEKELNNKIIQSTKIIEDQKTETDKLLKFKAENEKKLEALTHEATSLHCKLELKEKETEITSIKSSNKLKELECLLDEKENLINKSNLITEELNLNLNKISNENSLLKNKIKSLLENKISLEELSELGHSGENKLKNILEDYDRKIIEITDLNNEMLLIEQNVKALKEEKVKLEKELQNENSHRQKLEAEIDLLKENLALKLIEIKEFKVIVNDYKNNEENLKLKIKKLSDANKEIEDKLELVSLDNCEKINEIKSLNEEIDELAKANEQRHDEIKITADQSVLKIKELEDFLEHANNIIEEKDELITDNNNAYCELKQNLNVLIEKNADLQLNHKEVCEKLENTIKDFKNINEKHAAEVAEKIKIIENKDEDIIKAENKSKDFENQTEELLAKLENLKNTHKEELRILNAKHDEYLNSVKENIIISQKGESEVLKNYYENELKNKTSIYEDKIAKLNSVIESLEKTIDLKAHETNNLHNEIKVLELKLHNQESHIVDFTSKAYSLEKDLAEKINVNNHLEKKIHESDKKISQLEKQIEEKLETIKENQIEISNLSQKLKLNEEELIKSKESLVESEKSNASKNKELEELQNKFNKVKEFENLYNIALSENKLLKDENEKHNEEKNNLVNSLKEEIRVESLKATEKLKDYEKQIKLKEEEIVHLKESNVKQNQSLTELNDKNEAEKDSYEKAIITASSNIEKLTEDVKELKTILSKNSQEKEKLIKKNIQTINKLKEEHKAEIKSEVARLNEHIESLEIKLSKVKEESAELAEKHNQLVLENEENIALMQAEREKSEQAICELEEKISKIKAENEEAQKQKLTKLQEALYSKYSEEAKKVEIEKQLILEKLKEDLESNKYSEIENLKAELSKINNSKIEELEEKLLAKNTEIAEKIEKINSLLKSIETLNEEKSKLLEDNNLKENELYLENEKVNELEQLLENEKQITKILKENKIPALETEKTYFKNQLTDLELLYKQEAKNHLEALKHKEKELCESKAQISELSNELSKIRENLLKNKEEINKENDQLSKRVSELNKNLESEKNMVLELTKAQGELKAEAKELHKKAEMEKSEFENLKKHEEDLKLENKELKNKIAKLKIEFDEINGNQINEVNTHKKSSEILNSELDKVNKEISKLLFKLQVFEDNKNFSKIKKNFESESYIINSQIKNDSFEISNTNTNNNNSYTSISKKIDSLNIDSELQQINELVENKHKKIAEMLKRIGELEDEKKQVEKSLCDLNSVAEGKIKDYTEENKRLKHVNEEYNKKIFEAVSAKAPHLISSVELNSNVNGYNNSNNKNDVNNNSNNKGEEKDFLKALDLFKKFNDELNLINKEFEVKFLKATEKVKKYKKLYREVLSIKTNSNLNAPAEGMKGNSNEIDPNTHRIILDKEINGLKWFAVTYKDISDYEINHQNTLWIASTFIEDKLDAFNKFICEAEKNKEINDLYIVQEELLKKLAAKEEELIKIRSDRDNLIKKQKLNQNYDVNNPIYENTIPLEKYQVLLNNLIEEQEKFRTAVFQIEKLRLENESLKNAVEQSIFNILFIFFYFQLCLLYEM